MKIEKISENKIRCVLTREDLAARNIRISELAYGSEKARKLFQDMMLQAYNQYGFTNEGGIPLMIEAIPGSGSTLTIVITKVEDPEELDTRFATFSPTEEVADGPADSALEGADEIIDMLQNIMAKRASDSAGNGNVPVESASGTGETGTGTAPKKAVKPQIPKKNSRGKSRAGARTDFPAITRAYTFRDLDDVIRASGALEGVYGGVNSLYHLKNNGHYLLILHQSGLSAEDFNKVCNILSEYGTGENFTGAQEAYLREHTDAVIEGKALQKLTALA